jgi:hypothetical protein
MAKPKIYFLVWKGVHVYHSPNLTLINNINKTKYKNKATVSSR